VSFESKLEKQIKNLIETHLGRNTTYMIDNVGVRQVSRIPYDIIMCSLMRAAKIRIGHYAATPQVRPPVSVFSGLL
jgi:hypothetical protein